MKLSIEVIDCSFGVPASNVAIELWQQTDTNWLELAVGRTGSDGRLTECLYEPLTNGNYQIDIFLDDYYAHLGSVPLYLRAIVQFRIIDPTADLHLPVFVTPNSFHIYRGG
ncbi:MAG TPA: hydroxyisourate hydrolase [Streptosporangiaceae bacterium]|jgi:5-hydroxyisourate hydrolase|nr:hydroxyisourate hydrolase [Streptosporangiaceae bacterium]